LFLYFWQGYPHRFPICLIYIPSWKPVSSRFSPTSPEKKNTHPRLIHRKA
jgi:hypothetical protein